MEYLLSVVIWEYSEGSVGGWHSTLNFKNLNNDMYVNVNKWMTMNE